MTAPDAALVALIDERIAAAAVKPGLDAGALIVHAQLETTAFDQAYARNLRRLAERKTFPSRYLRDLVGVGVDRESRPVPHLLREPEGVGERGGDHDHAAQRAGQLHPGVFCVGCLLERGVRYCLRAGKRLAQVVESFRVDVHSLAPSVGPDRSVGPSSALGSASSAEDGTS